MTSSKGIKGEKEGNKRREGGKRGKGEGKGWEENKWRRMEGDGWEGNRRRSGGSEVRIRRGGGRRNRICNKHVIYRLRGPDGENRTEVMKWS